MKKLTSVPAVRLSCRQLTFDENEAREKLRKTRLHLEAREKLRKTRLHLNAHINLAAALHAGRMDKGEKHMTLAEYENIEKVKRLDFDRLGMLVSERIGALKLLAQGVQETDVHDAICRDLILPCVYTLAQFLESVKIEGYKK